MVTRKKAANRGNLAYRPTRQTITNRLLGVIVSDRIRRDCTRGALDRSSRAAVHRAVDKGHRVLATMTLRVVNIGQTQIWVAIGRTSRRAQIQMH